MLSLKGDTGNAQGIAESFRTKRLAACGNEQVKSGLLLQRGLICVRCCGVDVAYINHKALPFYLEFAGRQKDFSISVFQPSVCMVIISWVDDW